MCRDEKLGQAALLTSYLCCFWTPESRELETMIAITSTKYSCTIEMGRSPSRHRITQITGTPFAHVANEAHAVAIARPMASHASAAVVLGEKEAAMIDRLIDICTQFDQSGEEHLSQIVDRIGVSMMQAFLDRHAEAEPALIDD